MSGSAESARKREARKVRIEALGLTPADIVARMGLPVIPNADGSWLCPVCEDVRTEAVVGPHHSTHWADAGIEHPPYSLDRVRCPMDGCGVTRVRTSLSEHLVKFHGYTQPMATAHARIAGFNLDEYRARQAAAAEKAAERRGPGRPKGSTSKPKTEAQTQALVKVEPAVEAPVLSIADAGDAALAIVGAFANGTVPTAMLGEIVGYVDLTRDLAARLQAAHA